jgi:hypothetical protein
MLLETCPALDAYCAPPICWPWSFVPPPPLPRLEPLPSTRASDDHIEADLPPRREARGPRRGALLTTSLAIAVLAGLSSATTFPADVPDGAGRSRR